MAQEEATPPKAIRYDYIKSNQFRMIHADGVIGGPTPKGLVFLAFWNERPAIPQQVVHEVIVDEKGGAKVGNEDVDQRVSRQAIIRETEVGILLDLGTAKKLREWLGQKIETMVAAGVSDPEAK